MKNLDLDEIRNKLFVLQNYDKVFRGAAAKQMFPRCCGNELDLGAFLNTLVRPLEVEVDGEAVMMFEVTCPECGRAIPPEWRNGAGRCVKLEPEGTCREWDG